MKRLITTFALIALVPIIAFAQANSGIDPKISFGVRAGINVSTLNGDLEKLLRRSKVSGRVGFNLGVVMDVPLSHELYLQPGLFFTQKGSLTKGVIHDNFDRQIGAYRISSSANYLQLPVLLSIRPLPHKNLQWHINIGTYIAYGIGGEQDRDYSGSVYGQPGTEALPKNKKFFGSNGEYKRFDFGAILGLGASLFKVYLGAQYEFGFINIANQDRWGEMLIYDKKPSFKTGNFTVSLGYNF